MNLMTILIGLTAAAMLMLGFNMILPLNGTVDALCDLTGIACAVLFWDWSKALSKLDQAT